MVQNHTGSSNVIEITWSGLCRRGAEIFLEEGIRIKESDQSAKSTQCFQQSAKCMERISRPNAMDAQSWVELGIAFQNGFNYLDAEMAYHRATDIDPRNAFAHFIYGGFLEAIGERQRALQEYLIALDIDPAMGLASYKAANLLERINDLPVAIDCYRIYLFHRPGDAQVRRRIDTLRKKQERQSQRLAPSAAVSAVM